MNKKKIMVVFGTRPEAIKLAPVILALKTDPRFECRVVVTAQHREMLDQVLDAFDIVPDIDLNLMRANQTLSEFTARSVEALDPVYAVENPNLVLVQGDTTTVFCAALTAFYRHIPVGHVEAGLRSHDLYAPWPEEANRILTSRLATLHFAPTENSRKNLLQEGVPPDRIIVTGNTVIDALLVAVEKIKAHPPEIPGFDSSTIARWDGTPLILITGHRRENFGAGFESICRAIAELAHRFPETNFVYPVHLNPNVRKSVNHVLGSAEQQNVYLIEPLPYLSFVAMMHRATLILTDSGGIQEEAPSLGKPVLVMRDTTERPEALAAGTVKLVGTDQAAICNAVSSLLRDQKEYDAMAKVSNAYGDGYSSRRILNNCANLLFGPEKVM